MLEPAARLEEAEHLAIELGPIINGTLHVANMNEVERFGLEGPVKLGIIYLEA